MGKYGGNYGPNYQLDEEKKRSGGMLSRSRRRRRLYPVRQTPVKVLPPIKPKYIIVHDVSSRVVSSWETQLEGRVAGPVKVVHLEGQIVNEFLTELRGKLALVYESLAEGEVAINKEYLAEMLRRIYVLRQARRQLEQRGELEKENIGLKEAIVKLKEELESVKEKQKMRGYRK
jgi:hypothetical protein